MRSIKDNRGVAAAAAAGPPTFAPPFEKTVLEMMQLWFEESLRCEQEPHRLEVKNLFTPSGGIIICRCAKQANVFRECF